MFQNRSCITLKFRSHLGYTIKIGIVEDKVMIDFIEESKISHVSYHQIKVIEEGKSRFHDHLYGTREDIVLEGKYIIGLLTLQYIHATAQYYTFAFRYIFQIIRRRFKVRRIVVPVKNPEIFIILKPISAFLVTTFKTLCTEYFV